LFTKKKEERIKIQTDFG